MKKFFKELGEQYDYTWWWLLEQGMLISCLIVNTFFATIYVVAMAIIIFVLRWYNKH